MSVLAAGAATLALALVLPQAEAQEPGAWCAAAGLTLDLPEAWRIEREVPGVGLALRPPGEGAPLVELVTWRTSIGVQGPEQAAEEHEWVLAAGARYRRTGLTAAAYPELGETALVRGLVSGEDAEAMGSLFAAFARGSRAYAVGLFAPPDSLNAAQAQYLEPLLARLVVTGDGLETDPGHPPPPSRATRPAAPIEPITPAQPPRTDPAETTPPPAGRAPGRGPLRDPIGAAHDDPAGFSLLLPETWTCVAEGNLVVLSGSDEAMLVLAPLRAADPGRLDLEDFIARCLARLEAPRLVRREPGAATQETSGVRARVLSGTTPLEGVFTSSAGVPAGLLAGLIARPSDIDRLIPVAAEVIASFSTQVVPPSQVAPTSPAAGWRDGAGLIACRPPAGWVLRGGVERYDNRPVIRIHGETEARDAWFVWRQPVRPIFRDLTEAMQGLGFREGDPYYAYDGVDPRMVLTRGSAREPAVRYLLPPELAADPGPAAIAQERLGNLALLGRAREETALMGFALGEDLAAGTAWVVVSCAPVGDANDGWFWEAAGFGVGGRPGHAAKAARALEAVVRSTVADPRAEADTRSDLSLLLDRSQTALGSPTWRGLVGESAVGPGVDRLSPDGARLVPPASAVAAWRALASAAPASYNAAGAEPR
ncbi:MAG: hypothetical protein FJX74_21615 [Armatimonadetes bacterium]|nr:hypothetical protein [Armatimonadota bacterium]